MGWVSRFTDAVGISDQVDVESEAFNRAFAVRATDRKFAYDVLHPRHLELLLAGDRMGWWIEGTEILSASGEPIGRITSGGFGPTVNGPIAMGYVTSASAAPGTKVQLVVRGKPLPAEVVTMPFAPHRYFRKA